MRRPMGSFVRFALVGVASNALLYVGYLALTATKFGHKSSMTLCFALGTFLSFALNRNWSFKSTGPVRRAFLRYAGAYLAGYLLNFLALVAFVDWWGFRHEIVQAVMIVLVALSMFVAQRTWIFRERAAPSLAEPPKPPR